MMIFLPAKNTSLEKRRMVGKGYDCDKTNIFIVHQKTQSYIALIATNVITEPLKKIVW